MMLGERATLSPEECSFREVVVRYSVRPHFQRILPHLYSLGLVIVFGLTFIKTSPFAT
jgi:hypothetical protein